MTLRAALLSVGVLFVLAALFATMARWPGAIPLACVGAVLVLAILFERTVYKPADAALPGPEWQRTDERFVDPESGQKVTVFIRPATGERRYVQSRRTDL